MTGTEVECDSLRRKKAEIKGDADTNFSRAQRQRSRNCSPAYPCDAVFAERPSFDSPSTRGRRERVVDMSRKKREIHLQSLSASVETKNSQARALSLAVGEGEVCRGSLMHDELIEHSHYTDCSAVKRPRRPPPAAGG
jgi:hypothetical protein